ncbi:hypothetical protein LTR84_012767 [Exophiala bonariae]|uniref:NAD-dependent epimerase/dehydratase domain-containing protein n=1 Tax=Exophiala bonariae TaxID=1690606 RepID=A0AAV9NH77_9EURO|nr:hypothetical protein LTR84_012767 [Exophiala bonariae]
MSGSPISYVLLTGATGFIGAHVLDGLLHRGLKVRIAVRSLHKARALKSARPEHAHMLDVIQVDDYSTATSFTEAVKDVEGIVHVASPLSYDIKDNEEDMILPAINGTKSILQAALRSPLIQRVVITSSFAAVIDIDRKGPPYFTYTSTDWNPLTYDQAADNNSSAVVAYRGSKKFAELAAWEFMEQEKPRFDLVTLCPPMVFGPFVHPVERLEDLSDSISKLWEIVDGGELPVARVPFWVDVRDLAHAHVEALLRSQLRSKRYTIASPDRFSYQKASSIILDSFDWAKNRVLTQTLHQDIDESYGLDGEEAADELGLSYHSFQQSVVDLVAQAVQMESDLRAKSTSSQSWGCRAQSPSKCLPSINGQS